MRTLTPQRIYALKHYSRRDFTKDLTAGVIVAIIALPLSIALALASGVPRSRASTPPSPPAS